MCSASLPRMKVEYTLGPYGHRIYINGEVVAEKLTVEDVVTSLTQIILDRCVRAVESALPRPVQCQPLVWSRSALTRSNTRWMHARSIETMMKADD